jgi:pyruvate/2-oxoglutarate/acetoin dehydrogenase E1 component
VQEFGTDRVIDTPISEPGDAGIGVGAGDDEHAAGG